MMAVCSVLTTITDSDVCMFSAAVDMLKQKKPSIDDILAYGNDSGMVGIRLYLSPITNCPAIVYSENGQVVYYDKEGAYCRIYVASRGGEQEVRQMGLDFHAELSKKYANWNCTIV